MSRHFIFISFFLIHSIKLCAQNVNSLITGSVNDRKQLIKTENDWLKAEFVLDTAFLSSIMDETFIGISAEGVHNKKEDLLDMYNTIAQRNKDSIFIDSFKLENTTVNIYSTTAVVTFIVHTYRKNKGAVEERRTRFYDVWIKRKNTWKAVSSQGTKVS